MDHPRIRGEHSLVHTDGILKPGSSPHTRGARSGGRFLDCLAGSSPHTRGALVRKDRHGVTLRIIPAYAGSTLRLATFGTPARDHPRIRGEHTPGGGFISPGCGSSPHTRGAHPRHGRRRILDRIIPAYAGSTVCWSIPCAGAWDHPRIRGEHGDQWGQDRVRVGSSPHTRGARHHARLPAHLARIIPAYAGSTGWPAHHIKPHPDHPRIRGEHDPGGGTRDRAAGSSPHTRGALQEGLVGVLGAADHPRIRGEHPDEPHWIGTLAGSSPHTRGARSGEQLRPGGADHPRIRGEHADHELAEGVHEGSSPHTRGALDDGDGAREDQRIIPAYAGSTAPLVAAALAPVGSSPHTRGALGLEGGVPGYAGIIPAYAGSTDAGIEVLGGAQDHPRIRGEHGAPAATTWATAGSSPHTRGARQAILLVSSLARIIPAYAGSTSRHSWPTSPTEDHPRIRGEHRMLEHPLCGRLGSSPHTRGAPARNRALQPVPGIIPAYAGSTPTPTWNRRAFWDHPRIRGEHVVVGREGDDGDGSSPHTRGARPSCRRWRPACRIIPAYAGSTPGAPSTSQAPGDHPRIRGEHRLRQARPPGAEGSSPHTRGAQALDRRGLLFVRIIPAYAGSTPSTSGQIGGDADHPRIRGEHPIAAKPDNLVMGSSPHTRGAHRLSLHELALERIIPAYAGSTRT